MKQLILFTALMLAAPAVIAWPLCDSETGQNVRTAIMGPDFFTNLLLLILPFFVFAAIAIATHYGLPFLKRAAVFPESQRRGVWKQTESR